MFSGLDITIQHVLEEWIELMDTHFDSFLKNLDIIFKYSAMLLTSSASSTTLVESLINFFDDVFFKLIEKKYCTL